MSVDKPDAMDFLVAGLGGPGGIDAVSRRGHAQMRPDDARRASLPALPFGLRHGEPERAVEGTVFTKSGEVDHQAVLERAGVVFGEVQSHDKLFRDVVLPEGWTIKPTGHHMYSHLIDERGRRRAEIMYTAQDREAWYTTNRRFRPDAIRDDWKGSDSDDPYVPVIQDGDGNQLWRGPMTKDPPGEDPWRERSGHAARKIAVDKLSKLAPDWNDPTAYWGEDGDAIAWPPHETPPDTRSQYVLLVQCYRDGSYRDGGETNACKAHTDAEAKAELVGKCGLLDYYDEVRWTIKCGERMVETGTLRRPPPLNKRRDEYFYGRDPYGVRGIFAPDRDD